MSVHIGYNWHKTGWTVYTTVWLTFKSFVFSRIKIRPENSPAKSNIKKCSSSQPFALCKKDAPSKYFKTDVYTCRLLTPYLWRNAPFLHVRSQMFHHNACHLFHLMGVDSRRRLGHAILRIPTILQCFGRRVGVSQILPVGWVYVFRDTSLAWKIVHWLTRIV